MRARLIDVGSTDIKSALYDLKTGELSEWIEVPFPPAVVTQYPFYEVDVDEVERRVRFVMGKSQEALFLCTQMHGYVLMREGKACTRYISWRDTRAELAQLPAPLPACYGVKMKANLPRASIDYTQKYLPNEINGADTFCSLGSYLAYCLCGVNAAHITDLSASGFYNAESGVAGPYWLHLPKAHVRVELLGIEKYSHCRVYTPCGDQQTAVLGSGMQETSWGLNIGTASQLFCICDERAEGDFESRPYFGKKTLCTVSGLPGGRIIANCSDAEICDTLVQSWKEALAKLPQKNSLTVMGGVVKYRRKLLEECLCMLGVAGTFCGGNETIVGLMRLAKEIL